MPIKFPQADLPRAWRGGGDDWDTPAGALVGDEFFDAPLPPATGHSCRVDSSPLIAGAVVVGDAGHGVLGSEVPAGGQHGASILYNDLSLPADANREVRALVTAWPASGTLFVYEDGSFTFSAPDGAYSFQYQLYVDGVPVGSPATVALQIGAGGAAALKRWNGTAWVPATVKRWDGAAWVSATVKRWDGAAWITI